MSHRLSPEAAADLDDVWFYIATNGTVDAADRFIHVLTRTFLLLATHSRAGRARDDLAAGIRAFPIGDYLVLYRIDGNDVLVARVVRGSRDLEPLLDGK
jgi:toxin ParE1/3/4